MGRKQLVKRQAKHPMLEAKDPSGGVEKKTDSSNPSFESLPKTQTNAADLSSLTKADKQSALSVVRRSQRIQSAVSPLQDKEIKGIIEEITQSEGVKDDVPLDDEDRELLESVQTQKSLEEKVDYLLHQIGEQQKTIEELNFKVTSDSSPNGSPRGVDTRYRNLYFESQKKIESLTNENHQLALKLERALGKLEGYENGACAISEGLKKMKEMILVTNLTRSTETAVNFSTQAFPSMDAGAEPKASPKKKKTRTGK
ncbi:hypothetical protein HRI_004581200 [Hibiscus trionum]|uniref:Uncharacterized protein n=1 Tax=Hibiscus trionum TaxID=183268 RepID=A0A9W7J878_HIBTR|nr:hypothetical protein HRI_004581200 [Hibiscus trionum]